MRQEIVNLLCDLCGTEVPREATDTRIVSLDGRAREVDLCDPHNAELDRQFDVYSEVGRKASSVPARRKAPVATTTTHRPGSARAAIADEQEERRRVREWAAQINPATGEARFRLGDRGRIPQHVTQAYFRFVADGMLKEDRSAKTNGRHPRKTKRAVRA